MKESNIAFDRYPDLFRRAAVEVGASLKVSLIDRDEMMRWADRDRLRRELDQTVLSVLADVGLNLEPPANGPFVERVWARPGSF